MRQLEAAIERWALARPFVIARGVQTHVDVVRATVHGAGGAVGRGEGTPVYYRGDSAAAALAQLRDAAALVAGGATRAEVGRALPAGAARNALDAALWDLEAKESGVRAWAAAGLPAPRPMLTALTISLGDPAAMAAAAAAAGHRELLKLKLGGEGDAERVAAVRRAAPDARLIADANESWAGLDVERLVHALAALRVELVEQPLPVGADADLARVRSPIPICADESVQDGADLDAVAGRYAMINVKLDKCGGLTAALALVAGARARGLGVMTGCMLGTSLGVAPAFLAAMHGSHADLDAPLLLARDRAHGLSFRGSDVGPPDPALWG